MLDKLRVGLLQRMSDARLDSAELCSGDRALRASRLELPFTGRLLCAGEASRPLFLPLDGERVRELPRPRPNKTRLGEGERDLDWDLALALD